MGILNRALSGVQRGAKNFALNAKDSALDAIRDPGERAESNLKEHESKLGKTASTVEKARTTANVARHGARYAGYTVSALGNPITWFIFLMVIVLLVAIAFAQVFGMNENADGCFGLGESSSNSSTSVNVDNGKNGKERAENVGAWLTSNNFKFNGNKAMSKEQAAAFIGNWLHESGGELDPSIGQAGMDVKNASNSDIKNISGSGRAVGIVQWDGDRRTKLAEFADEKGGKWNDLNIQLEFFKKEMDESYGDKLAAAGFGSKDKSVDELVDLVNRYFEGSGDWNYGSDPALKQRRDERVRYAKEFMEGFTGSGSYSSQSGGSCMTSNDSGDSNASDSDVVKLAISMSYPMGSEEDNVSGGDSYGKNNAKPEYKKKKKEAEDKTDPDPQPGLYASCDRFVATVLRNTVDKSVPWGSTSEQQAYFSKSSKWKQYEKKSEAKPGDVWITKTNGHVVIYLGKVNGQDAIANASYLDRVAGIDPASYLNDSMVDTSGRPYYGYHYNG